MDVVDPEEVGVQEREGNHRYGHQVHIEAQNDCTVFEAPVGAHAAGSVGGAQDHNGRGDQKKGGCPVVGKVREPEREQHAAEYQQIAAGEGTEAWIEEPGCHGSKSGVSSG